MLTTIQEIVVNLIGSEEVAIFEFAEDANEFRLASSFGVDLSRLKSFKAGSGPIGQRLLGGEVFVNDHVSGGEDKLTACVPLRIGERIIGAILVFRLLEHKQGLQPVDHELFELLGIHASTALYCANLHELTVGGGALMAALNPMPDPAAIDPSEKLRTVYLYPGQVFTASQPLLVSTILGSCIAVCLWDERRASPASITTCCRAIRCADSPTFATATSPSSG